MKKNIKVLLVDDDRDFVEATKMVLDTKYDVISAYNGDEGLKKARQENPDLIILDVMMPKISGFDVCRKLKVDPVYKDIPIIMLTAKFQPNDIDFGKSLGAEAYITKPFEPQVLLEKMRELLKK
jgi:DNA-binding response OmpR family regulator